MRHMHLRGDGIEFLSAERSSCCLNGYYRDKSLCRVNYCATELHLFPEMSEKLALGCALEHAERICELIDNDRKNKTCGHAVLLRLGNNACQNNSSLKWVFAPSPAEPSGCSDLLWRT